MSLLATDTAETPTVSIIMIFRNTQRFISEAIESIFAQTYDDWELLLVDDGSVDASTEIARGHARRHPQRIRYLEHPCHRNRGMSASRNLGLAHARGRYIAFLDADDVWLEEKLEQQVAILDGHPEVGMLVGATLYWYSWTGRREDAARDAVVMIGRPSSTPIRPPGLLTECAPLGPGNAPSMSNMMYRREIVEQIGGFEDQFRDHYEDGAFLAKMYLGTSALITDHLWDRYRQHMDSTLASTWPQHRDAARRDFFEWLEAHLSARGLQDSKTWECVQGRVWECRHPVLASLMALGQSGYRESRALAARGLAAGLPLSIYARLKAWLGAARGDPAEVHLALSVASWHERHAKMMLNRGQAGAAAVHYRRALELDPKRADRWIALADVLLDTGAKQEAVAAISRALAIKAEAGWYVLRMRALLELGRFDEAIEDYRRAVEIDRDRAEPWAAELLAGAGDAEGAHGSKPPRLLADQLQSPGEALQARLVPTERRRAEARRADQGCRRPAVRAEERSR